MLARQILAEIFGAEKKKVGERFVSKKCRGRERSIARIFGQFGARGVAARRGATRRKSGRRSRRELREEPADFSRTTDLKAPPRSGPEASAMQSKTGPSK